MLIAVQLKNKTKIYFFFNTPRAGKGNLKGERADHGEFPPKVAVRLDAIN